ncbi:hypothetical protein HIM_08077 [Hirsutella minnesotensis 3608]|uniref:MICOS complex subunit mic19 n=1 Tax=Hirsutella minnesotensis 3608 TaxID=1043627 RepID=A0A0F7ZT61_9HYPO|nr:hypothetical protein HIM_08077 [Hirsutella minnesotensis 3608]
MGNGNSKPDARGGYEWKAAGPPNVSLDVLESLQSSPETDASRAKLIEKHVQARVAEELKKLQRRESEALEAAHQKIASQPADHDDAGPSRFTLGKEVEELRHKLEGRKQLRPVPDSVEKARGEVVRCLRENDRRPLDCWQEVENFKAEVKKLEKGWVDRVIS